MAPRAERPALHDQRPLLGVAPPYRPIRVAIDAHSIGRRATGNETYVDGLLAGLLELDEGDVEPIVIADQRAELPGIPERMVRRLHRRTRALRLLVDLAAPRRSWGAALLHRQYLRPPVCDVPCVSTIHDISFEHHPELFTRRALLRMKGTIPWSARRSALVLTGSEFSRTDLLERYRLPASRVRVTPYAASARFSPQPPAAVKQVRQRYELPADYVLYVGNLQPRKNLSRLLAAYASLPTGSRPPLVIVGQRAWLTDEMFSTLRELDLKNRVHFTGYVPVDDLPAIYGGATVFAYPSLFEGFGLPVLEALACGVPTLTSASTALAEVAGDAAVLVDPYDVGAIADGLLKLLTSDETRRCVVERGLIRAREFSWARCASDTVAAYRTVVG